MEAYSGMSAPRILLAAAMQKLAALNLTNYRVLLSGSRSPLTDSTPRHDSDWDLLLVPTSNPVHFSTDDIPRTPRNRVDEFVRAAQQVAPTIEKALWSLIKSGFFRNKGGVLKRVFEKFRSRTIEISIKVLVRTPEGWGWIYALEKDKEPIHNDRILMEKDYHFFRGAVFLDDLFDSIESGKPISEATVPAA